MSKRLVGLMVVVLLLVGSGVVAQDAPQFEGTIPAPEFPADLDWFNVETPLTMDGLRGKVVLLDFWTYGCINCIHMIPVLQELEEKYADELVVIGVHSAKFDNERNSDNIREIIQRYNIHHPVINDRDFRVWELYFARAWPTFAVIAPNGNVVALQAGEVPFEAFDRFLSGLITHFNSLGEDTIDRTPLELALEGAGDPGTPLLYPGKVLVDADGERLFIADTNHHRIVVTDLNTYEVQMVIGSGQRGYAEGTFDVAQFNQPQGMALSGEMLYVADVNNHVLRAIDLTEETVTSIAGTGDRGDFLPPVGIVPFEPLDVRLRSPWALEFNDDESILYIAMAGTHQLWSYNFEMNRLEVVVGNGREAQLSTTLAGSELAQPSGLHWHAGKLFFADSESSTVRVADFNEDTVDVIAGTTENSLFSYGDLDGLVGESLLQHVLGVAGTPDGETLFFADTYNDKIKIHVVETGETTTLAGNVAGFQNGALAEALFHEPGGLDYHDGLLYVADTNNHSIRVIDLEAETVRTISFPNPQALIMERNEVTILGGNAGDGLAIELEAQTVGAGTGELIFEIIIPEAFKINPLTESFIDLSSDDDAVTFEAERILIEDTTVNVPLELSEGDATLTLEMTLFYCEAENEAYCLIEDVRIMAPIMVAAEGASIITIEHMVHPPENFEGGF